MVVAARPDENQPSKGHIVWFDEKWELSEPWNRAFIEEILKPSPIGVEQQQSPIWKRS